MNKNKPGGKLNPTVRGIPNGISYELDKDRANRIKTLGNAIVPQIAREFGQSKKLTPTAIKGDNSFKYAAKFIKGKTKRSSKENVGK